jgi:hypothetical protein
VVGSAQALAWWRHDLEAFDVYSGGVPGLSQEAVDVECGDRGHVVEASLGDRESFFEDAALKRHEAFPEAARTALAGTRLRANLCRATGTIRDRRLAVAAETGGLGGARSGTGAVGRWRVDAGPGAHRDGQSRWLDIRCIGLVLPAVARCW